MLRVSIKSVRQPESCDSAANCRPGRGARKLGAENTMLKLSFQSSRTSLPPRQTADSWPDLTRKAPGSDHHLPTALAKVYATARRRTPMEIASGSIIGGRDRVPRIATEGCVIHA